MPTYLREPAGRTCWNCDREDDEAVRVTVRTPTGGEATFPLCRPCYHAIYSTVARLADEAGIAITAREGRSDPV